MVKQGTGGAAILLAAGFSLRFGRDKRLERLGSDSLLNHVCRVYSEVFHRVIVVLRTDDHKVESSLSVRHEVAHSEHSRKGMSQSLITGVQSALNEPWVVIALADMPFVKRQTLCKIRDKLCRGEDQIVRPRHRGKPGNPVGFPSCFFDRLQALTGDEGAKKIVEDLGSKVFDLYVDDPGIHLDLDTPESFRRLTGLHQRRILHHPIQ